MNAAWLVLVAFAGDPAVAPHVPEDGGVEGGWRVRLDASATWGIGGQMFLGLDLHPSVYRPVWATRRATGTVDLGLDLAYGNEPTFLAPWIDRDEVQGAGHRLQVLGTVGGTFHLAPRRRVGVGLHGVAGLNEWISSYSVRYAEEGVEGSAVVRDTLFVAGGRVTVSWRLHRHVGLNVVAMAFLPTSSSYAVGFGHVGAGLSFYLR